MPQLLRPAIARSVPIGAQVVDGGVHFRVWAPRCARIAVVVESPRPIEQRLEPDGDGYFAGLVEGIGDGALYRFRLDDDPKLCPDPTSRFQPQGVHGPSRVIDPRRFRWSDDVWPGVAAAGQVLYEMHIGAFTQEGTWRAAMEQLPALRELGVTCLEVMPVNTFAGRWGWGYDGVALFAPFPHYGSPDDMRAFVDAAHAAGLGVILDVVYNHLGPDGNYIGRFTDTFFSPTHRTDWGDAINFDGPGSAGVREFFLANVRLWIEEYHLDGFRFDATQAMVDPSPRHILAEIAETARRSAGRRGVYLVNENEPQHTGLVRPIDRGGCGTDALWNDDFHHSAMVALTGRSEAYYSDYRGSAQEMISSAKWGYLYHGQRYKWQQKRRGTPALDLPPTAFIHFLQNHDQIANSGRGFRIHQLTGPAQLRAMTALLLLMPQTPMLFQGQEFAADNPFLYFADHNAELTKLIREGRAKELSQFPSIATEAMRACLADPAGEETFNRCKLDHTQRELGMHKWMYDLHRDLLKLRREDAAFRRVQKRGDVDGAVLARDAFVLRFFASSADDDAESLGADDRLLVVNLGRDIDLDPAPEPLLAPPIGRRWRLAWSSEDPNYGGSGTPPLDTEQEGWRLPAHCTVLLTPRPEPEAKTETRHATQGSAQEAKRRE